MPFPQSLPTAPLLPFQITPIANDSAPNAVAPSQARLWQAPSSAIGNDQGSSLVAVLSDGTNAVCQLWELIDTGKYAQIGAPFTLTAGVVSAPVGVQANAQIFLQVVSTVGSPTTLYAGFSRLPAGTTTSTVEITGSLPNPSVQLMLGGTIVANGSALVPLPPCNYATLVVNVKGVVTGTNPTLFFTLVEVDPADGTTAIGTPVSGQMILAAGVQKLVLAPILTGTVRVSWTIGGTSTPTFPNVNLTLVPQTGLIGQYNANRGYIPDGAGALLQIDPNGFLRGTEMQNDPAYDAVRQTVFTSPRPLLDATSALVRYVSASGGAALAGVIVKAAAGRIYQLEVTNTNATTPFYFQFFDATSLPTSGTTLAANTGRIIPAASTVNIDCTIFGINLLNGCVVGASSTPDLFTSIAAKDLHYRLEYTV